MGNHIKSILSRIRYQEALIFQTPTMLGLAMFVPGFSPTHVVDAIFAALGSFLVMASIFATNDWADIDLDSKNTLKRKDTFLESGIDQRQMLGLAISLAAAGLMIFTALSRLHVLTALGALVFGLAYSVPVRGIRGKSIPIFSSCLHFGGTLLSFLLGTLTFSAPTWHGLLIASYPALLITAGHLVQEVEDYEQDRIAQCDTNAVRFGRKPAFVAAAILFGLSFALLYWLVGQGFFPHVIKYTVLLYLLYIALAMRAYRAGLTRDSVRFLRSRYRIMFAVVLLAMLVGSLMKNGVL